MRNKNYIDRIFLRLSTIFTIIKSFALLSIKKKKPYLSHKYPISKWFGTSLHQKEIKKIRPNPPKYPSILFPNFSTFILIQTLALLTHPLSKTFTLTTVTLAHSILPRRIHRRHPISNFDTQLPAENVNTLYWKGGEGSRKPYSTRDLTRNTMGGIHRNDATLPKWCRVTLLIFG